MNNPTITALITVQEKNNSNLPDAHFRDFSGKPLFQWMIDKLLAVKTISTVVITTDSDSVQKIYGDNNKVSIIDFPDSNTLSDQYSSARILEEMPTSDWLTAHSLKKTSGEHFMQTQCINPLLSIQTIENAIEHYYNWVLNPDSENQFDSVMSLSRVEKRLYDNSNYPKITLRNEPHFVIFEDTVFNIFSRSHFARNNNRKFGKNPMFFDVPEIENLTVESPASYKLAQLAFEHKASLL